MKLLNNIITQRGGILRIKQNQKPKTQSIKNLNSVDKQFILLHNAVQFCFNEIAKINKWSAKDINDALNEYFNNVFFSSEKLRFLHLYNYKNKTHSFYHKFHI